MNPPNSAIEIRILEDAPSGERCLELRLFPMDGAELMLSPREARHLAASLIKAAFILDTKASLSVPAHPAPENRVWC